MAETASGMRRATVAFFAALAGACGGGGAPAQLTEAGAPDVAAPAAAPDLRFKWVGAGFTLRLELTTYPLGDNGVTTRRGPVGLTPPLLTGDGFAHYSTFSTSPAVEPLDTVAAGGDISDLAGDLDEHATSRSIVASLDASATVYNAHIIGTVSGRDSYLPRASVLLPHAEFPAWVATQGMRGMVVTAVSPEATGLRATAFGRAGDTNTYEARVVTRSLDAFAGELAALSDEGFFITAVGRDGTGSNGRGGFVAVGTRVNGRSERRSLELVDVPCVMNDSVDRRGEALRSLFAEGYAIVGEIFHGGGGCDGTPSWLYIAQR